MDYTIILFEISFITRCYAYVISYNLLFGKFYYLFSFSCIGLLDRFLQKCITASNESNGFVTQNNLQLIAVATFLIAAKVEVSQKTLFSVLRVGVRVRVWV
jgi:hypothetical protein